MKSFLSRLVLALIVSLPLAASADEGGWSLPNLNPFASKGKPPTSAPVTSGSGSWQMPSLWPSGGKRSGPSTWQKMTTGTKTFFAKTADVLNPWDDAKPEATVAPSGRGSLFSRKTDHRKQQESSGGSWLTSWWTAEEEPQRPKTVSDFLAQPRPDP